MNKPNTYTGKHYSCIGEGTQAIFKKYVATV